MLQGMETEVILIHISQDEANVFCIQAVVHASKGGFLGEAFCAHTGTSLVPIDELVHLVNEGHVV